MSHRGSRFHVSSGRKSASASLHVRHGWSSRALVNAVSMNKEESPQVKFKVPTGAPFDLCHPDGSSVSTRAALVIRLTCTGILFDLEAGGVRLRCLILTDVSCHLPYGIIPTPLPIGPLYRSPIDPLLISSPAPRSPEPSASEQHGNQLTPRDEPVSASIAISCLIVAHHAPKAST